MDKMYLVSTDVCTHSSRIYLYYTCVHIYGTDYIYIYVWLSWRKMDSTICTDSFACCIYLYWLCIFHFLRTQIHLNRLCCYVFHSRKRIFFPDTVLRAQCPLLFFHTWLDSYVSKGILELESEYITLITNTTSIRLGTPLYAQNLFTCKYFCRFSSLP